MTKQFQGSFGTWLMVLGSCFGLETIALAEGPPAIVPQPEVPVLEASPAVSVDQTVHSAIEQSTDLNDLENANAIGADSSPAAMTQVTSVSQLTDVRPTDWAFQALQSLVERYGCIVGYPDRTYRGNQALTRYEFAAGLNACLDRVSELIAAATTDLVRKEDLETLRKLQEEFAAELATLRGRVEVLEVRTANLEKQQISTTTKLNVELVTYLADAFGEDAADENNTNLGYRLRLDFDTSFTGKDRLRTRLQSTNLRGFIVPSPDETRFLATSLSSDGEMTINRLQYRFPVGDKLTLYLDANSIDPSIITDPITPFNDQVLGSLSNFAQINPIWFPIGNQAGLGFNYVLTPNLQLDGGYQAESGANEPSLGVFNGGYSAFANLIFTSGTFKASLFYINSYSPEFGVDTLAGSNAAKVIGAGPVVANGYGFQFDYRIATNFGVGGWVGKTAARTLGSGTKGDADVWNFALDLAFPDLGGKGNLGGIVFGMQPKLTDTSNDRLAQAIGLPTGQREDRDTGFHIELFYRYRINDNIYITPGFFWLTAPNHDDRNPDVFVGAIRTTFLF